LQKWLNLHFGPEQSCTNKFRKKRQLRFIMQHTVSHFKCRLSELRCKLSEIHLLQVGSSDELTYFLTYLYLFGDKCAKYQLRST
jgi:hypothetical protein